MFSRRRSNPEPTPETPEEPTEVPGTVQKKGRPTPRRSTAEAARKRPLVPTDRKAAARTQRAAAREQRDREYKAMQTGDEKNLPLRDRGPIKRWIRDYVDARRNLGEYFLPVALVMVFSTFVTANNITAGIVVIMVLYLVVVVTIADAFILSRVLKRRLNARFGEGKVPRGSLMYGVLRAFQIRRTRLPRPQVKRGEYPV
ncbi:DUF3043 domain-containing protein [Actinotalea sp. BY-33]|uniref:DUF3043 domain-containing protein n=1 Tax=Actinotalea soli TaxID=2819234 RepID=A0A939LPM3_9CELL|nr:DUF3043 domain-containing protein [Actinotalea soli]MBO1750605.1 DUF3043 domain-containing protein [Actinotalea soli]